MIRNLESLSGDERRKRRLPNKLLSSDDLHLRQGVYFVEGAKNAALCDTETGVVYSVNKVGSQVLLGAMVGDNLWQALETAGLATREPINTNEEFQDRTLSLDFVWFEISTSICNEKCVHCYADCVPPSDRRKYSEPVVDRMDQGEFIGNERLGQSEWLGLITQAYQLGARWGQFIGGEPFMYRGEKGENVLDLAEYSKMVGYEFIEIFTNATMINKERVERMKAIGLNVAVSLYSTKEGIHDAITRTRGSFRKTMKALNLLRAACIPTRVEVVVMKENQETVEDTIRWIEENGFSHKQPDILRPKGRGDNPLLQPDKEVMIRSSLMTRPNFFAQRETFLRNMNGNSCLAGKIAITEFGEVLPCIFSRNVILGNVLHHPLDEVINSPQMQEVWRSTKDDVLVCQDCEYRYVCSDCRPISEAVNEGRGAFLTAPYPRCTYNPYIGEWAGGIWKVNEQGKPYYDTALQGLIRELTEDS